MYYRKHIPQHDKRRGRAVCALIMVFLMVFFILIDVSLKPIMRTAIEQRTRQLVTASVNAAVSEVLAQNGMTYTDFVKLTCAEDGSVMSLQTDSPAVNLFRAQVSEAMARELAKYKTAPTKIPIGSLTGINMLAGRGASIRLNMNIDGSVAIELESSFSEAGINQTLHTIKCVVTADIYAVIPGMSTPVRVNAGVMVAQSVIVGDTPESFTYVYGDQSDNISRVFDYGDPYGKDIE